MADGHGKPSPNNLFLPALRTLSVEEPSRNGNENGTRPPDPEPPQPTPVPAPRRPLRPLVAALLMGLLFGGTVGGLGSGLSGSGSSATALVQLSTTPDPGLAALSGKTQSDNALADFIASEFAWLSSDGLTTAVAARLNIDPDAEPAISVTRIGQSSVVTFSAHGKTDEEALQLARTAVDIYTARRLDSLRASVTGSLASVDQTLKDIAAPPPARNEPAAADPRLERLLTLRSDLLLVANRNDSGVQVLEPAALSRPGSPPWIVGTILGAALGGLLTVGGLALYRGRRRTLEGAADAVAIADRVLHPEVVLPRDWRTNSLHVMRKRDRYTSRLLATQIARRRTMAGRTIAVVGASPASASRVVATMIAVGLTPQVPTSLVEFDTSAGPHPLATPNRDGGWTFGRTPTHVNGLEIVTFSRVPQSADDEEWTYLIETAKAGKRCVVLDVGSATTVMNLLPARSESVLVLGAGVDDTADATALASAVRIDTSPLLGVVTRQPWFMQLRRGNVVQLNG